MRIISGEFRGRRLRAPAGLATRPTPDRLREALFNILGAEVVDASFLDLFAGSGAVGIEAVSRGAARVVAVENSRRALEALEANVELCGAGDRLRIVAKEATSALRSLGEAGEQFDLVYVDPPYDADLYSPTLTILSSRDMVSAEGTVVVERRTWDKLRDEYGRLRHYRDVTHGNSTLSFFHPS